MNDALPGTRLLVNGVNSDVCSVSSRWRRGNVDMTTVSGERYQCMGTSEVQIQLLSGASVVPFKTP